MNSAFRRLIEPRLLIIMGKGGTGRTTIAAALGTLAARKGDYRTARRKADEFARLVEPDANPRKMEPMHELLGLTSLLQGNYDEAIGHYDQGNPNNPYNWYHLALAHEGAGNTSEAKQQFGKVADNNFNNVAVALVRKEAMEKRQ